MVILAAFHPVSLGSIHSDADTILDLWLHRRSGMLQSIMGSSSRLTALFLRSAPSPYTVCSTDLDKHTVEEQFTSGWSNGIRIPTDGSSTP
ncbi:UNVERIFIED_CONTAM: hypothetical protein Sradi_5061800 [Sesamum radiatum]|uniref:Uncharacterized protein n=1 Tax=Sesamum radiatum TaxID=300843 RepID=A0AAW2M351_SESRA